MSISARVGLQSNRGRIIKASEQGAHDAVSLLARYTSREARRLLRQRIYPPAGPENTGPPAYRSGDLERSVRPEVQRIRGRWVGIVGSTEEYARWLELGTSKMAKRPFLRPALDKTREEAPRILFKAFNKRYRVTGRVV